MGLSLKKIKNKVVKERDRLNINNMERTNFYYKYWYNNKEIPWALLANFVSRNAGYQMTDLIRFKVYLKVVKKISGPLSLPFVGNPAIIPANVINLFSSLSPAELDALYTFLESGNFIIFHDVFPALRLYQYARNHAGNNEDHAMEIINLLNEKEFHADPFIIEKWREFFKKGMANKWSEDWKNNWAPTSDIERHSFALIINEQNQIEDRLVHPTPKFKGHYLSKFTGFTTNTIIEAANKLGLTKLLFPTEGVGGSPSKLQKTLLYTVKGFANLEDRINTGRHLYKLIFNHINIYNKDPYRDYLIKWAEKHQGHTASRRDYYPPGFSINESDWKPLGKTFSPQHSRYKPEKGLKDNLKWNKRPGKTPKLIHTHDIKILKTLPKDVASRGKSNISKWLDPMKSNPPASIFEVAEVKDEKEILI